MIVLRSGPARVTIALAAATLVAALAACAPTSPPAPTPSGSTSPDPVAAPEPTETPTPTDDDASSGLAPDDVQNIQESISSGNTAALEGYLTDPTRVVIASSEADDALAPVDAVLAVDYVGPGVGTWDFALDDATLDAYAASPYYAAFFPPDAIVGRSSEGPVIAFSPDGAGRIDTIFMAIDEALILNG